MKIFVVLAADESVDELITPLKAIDYKKQLADMVVNVRSIMRVIAKNKDKIKFKQIENIVDQKIANPMCDIHDYMEEVADDPMSDELFKKMVKLLSQTTHSKRITENLDKSGVLTVRQVSWVLNAMRRFYKYINFLLDFYEYKR